MAGGRKRAPVLAAKEAREFLDGQESGGQGRLRVPRPDAFAVLDYKTEGLALRGKKTSVNRGYCPVADGRSLSGEPLCRGPPLLIGDRDFVFTVIEKQEGQRDSPRIHPLDPCSERDNGPGRRGEGRVLALLIDGLPIPRAILRRDTSWKRSSGEAAGGGRLLP
tara:strand:- start:1798 stop:2289 length:492 start_codon:yes stop_codon:yes gene_type:complete